MSLLDHPLTTSRYVICMKPNYCYLYPSFYSFMFC
ncbi:hypothetical protein KSS87_016345, partial [Heliosperma pusillum]